MLFRSIEQRKNLQILNDSSSYELLTYSLIIDEIRVSDNGTYSCQSDNKIIKLFRLNIIGKPRKQKEPVILIG